MSGQFRNSLISHQETKMTLSKFVCENTEGSGASVWASWQRQAVAVGTAALLALYAVAPASATAAGAAASPAAMVAPSSPAGGCHLNSPRGKISHVVTIIFDNTHFL